MDNNNFFVDLIIVRIEYDIVISVDCFFEFWILLGFKVLFYFFLWFCVWKNREIYMDDINFWRLCKREMFIKSLDGICGSFKF